MISLSVTDILTHLVVTFLTPMFLATTGGDLDQARAAALATVQACTIRNPLDLLLVGQLIALSFATLCSVSQSMDEDLSINQVLRLRGNAANLHRASENCRAALPEPVTTTQDEPLTAAELAAEAEVIAEVKRLRQRVIDHKAALARPAASPAQPDPDFPPRFPEDFDTMKAAMAQIVAESDRRAREAPPGHAPTARPQR